MTDKVTIIIPTYNNLECIKRVTESIAAKTAHPYDLLILNNNSTDQAVLEYLSAINGKESVQVITLPKNIYYWPAVNIGIMCSNRDNPYTLIMNDDIIIENNQWLEKMIHVLKSSKKISLVGPFFRPKYTWPPFFGFVVGSCLLVKTSVFQEVGLFSLKHLWHTGDIDYMLKLYKHGYKIKGVKGTSLSHIEGATRLREQSDSSKDHSVFISQYRYRDLLLHNNLFILYAVHRLLKIFASIIKKFLKLLNLKK